MSEKAEQVKRLLAKADGSSSMPRAHTEKKREEKRCQHGPLTFLLLYFCACDVGKRPWYCTLEDEVWESVLSFHLCRGPDDPPQAAGRHLHMLSHRTGPDRVLNALNTKK